MEQVSYLQCHCYANLKSQKCITKLYLILSFFFHSFLHHDVGKIFNEKKKNAL